MSLLLNKTAIVTGASSGIGRATAKLFAQQGANVVVTARRKSLLDDLVNEIGESDGCVQALPGDITEENFVKQLIGFTTDKFGELDIAVNNAGILGPSTSLWDTISADWHGVINTNLSSAFLCAKYQLPAMIESGGGSVIFVSSFVGHTVGMPGMTAYSASKSGLIGLTLSLAVEAAEHNIRVNALLPGGTETAMGQEATSTAEAKAFVENIHALKRMARPQEIANSALYLASDYSSFTTGSALLVDGGVSICKT